jgi:TonB-linked SusC/RagA family outer membrane protein
MNLFVPTSFRCVTGGLLALLASGAVLTTAGQTLASARTGTRAQIPGQVTTPAATQALRNLLTDLEQTYGVRFNYRLQVVRDVRVLPTPLGEFDGQLATRLNQLLGPAGLQCKALDARTFVIQPRAVRSEPVLPPSSAVPAPLPEPVAERPADRTLTGRVTGETGEALPGVSVTLKGTTRGTVTGADGSFQLSVPDGPAVLVFSSVGYERQEITVGNQTTIALALKPDNRALDEVVVVGYGAVRRADLTGSVASVGEAAIKATPVVAVDRALQGRAAGVQVTTNSARPGGGTTVRIRGTGSINAGNEPLYVIDGYPTGDLNSVNPADIESVEILKDASATAIYGSRGSNGVVMITTKRGKAGQSTVNFESYYGIQTVRRKIPLLNARQYAEFVNEARVNAGGQPYFNGSAPDRPLPENLGAGTDWQDEVFRPAPMQSYQLSFTGGEARTRYAISGNYFEQQGILLNSFFRRYTLRTNLDRELSNRFKIGLSMQGAFTQSNSSRTETDGGGSGGVTNAALNFAPVFPVFNASGTYYRDQSPLNGNLVDNPVGLANEITDQFRRFRLLTNAFAEYHIREGLTLRSTFGVDLSAFKSNFYATRLINLGANANGTASVSAGLTPNWLNENTLTYTRTLAEKHSLTALLGYTFQGFDSENVTANAQNFNDDFAQYNNLGAGGTLQAPGSSAGQWRLISYLARVNYGFADRLLLTLTARRDGSSRFGPTKKFGFFPSGAVAWKLVNEPFLRNQTLFSDLKVRASYGLTGNQEIGEYRFLSTIANAVYAFGNPPVRTVGAAPGGISNLDLRWERNAQFDVGLDLALAGNRVQLTLDYYVKTTSDLLFNVNVPQTTGFNSSLQNIGKVENRGLEMALNTINLNTGGLRWTTEFNLAFNRNKILTLDGRPEFTAGDGSGHLQVSNTVLLRVGDPLGNFFGRVVEGIFQNQAEIDASAQRNARPGDLRYRDLNNDGTINDADRAVIGNGYPTAFGGLNNTLTYKGFDLNIFFQGSFGNEILNFGLFDLYNLNSNNNQSVDVLNRWTPTNPSNEIPRANSAGGQRILSSFHIEDGSYIRLRNLSLGYTLPEAVLRRSGFVQGAKVYVAAQNYLTFTRYSGYDPEVSRFGTSAISQGMDYGGYPAAKTLLVGLNLRF